MSKQMRQVRVTRPGSVDVLSFESTSDEDAVNQMRVAFPDLDDAEVSVSIVDLDPLGLSS